MMILGMVKMAVANTQPWTRPQGRSCSLRAVPSPCRCPCAWPGDSTPRGAPWSVTSAKLAIDRSNTVKAGKTIRSMLRLKISSVLDSTVAPCFPAGVERFGQESVEHRGLNSVTPGRSQRSPSATSVHKPNLKNVSKCSLYPRFVYWRNSMQHHICGKHLFHHLCVWLARQQRHRPQCTGADVKKTPQHFMGLTAASPASPKGFPWTSFLTTQGGDNSQTSKFFLRAVMVHFCVNPWPPVVKGGN